MLLRCYQATYLNASKYKYTGNECTDEYKLLNEWNIN